MGSTKRRRLPWKKSACITALVFGASATAAIAYTNTDYFYGAPGVTQLNESSVGANCHIWGLNYTHNITGCKGDNYIVADGQCPPGTKNGDNDEYCEVTQDPKDPGDTLRGGGGDNIIIGGGGPNTIYGGTGSNGIYVGPSTNTYYGGNNGDAVYAGQGSGTLNLGKGSNVVYASSSGVYHIICTGKNDYIFMDSHDTAKNCAHVSIIGPSADTGSSRRHRSHRASRKHTSHKRTSHKRVSRKHS